MIENFQRDFPGKLVGVQTLNRSFGLTTVCCGAPCLKRFEIYIPLLDFGASRTPGRCSVALEALSQCMSESRRNDGNCCGK